VTIVVVVVVDLAVVVVEIKIKGIFAAKENSMSDLPL